MKNIDIKHTFKSVERLKSKKLIGKLFVQGKAWHLHPIRVLYYVETTLPMTHHKVLFGIAKQKCKQAVVRNKLKRRMREAYRLSKHTLESCVSIKRSFLIGFVYIGKPHLGSFQIIQKKIKQAIDLLNGLPE